MSGLKLLSFTLLLLCSLPVAGCYSYRPMNSPLPDSSTDSIRENKRRLELRGGETVTMEGVWQDSTTVTGFDLKAKRTRSVPRDQILEIQEPRINGVRTTFAGLFGGMALFVVLFSISWANSW